ncbi:MAG: hypothetical protein NTX19_02295 [Gemmatimonadetes bacterium]|nr:hypothetical protein [Gemmatimonadota bacterium]
MFGARVKALFLVLCLAPSCVEVLQAQRGAGATSGPPRQTQSDDYTRYELLAPGTGKFRILYEVTATTPGATQFFNAIRQGSVASDESVWDRMTGKALKFDEVGAEVARAGGVGSGRGAVDTLQKYIRVYLARTVPEEGEGRVLIDKTYYDPKSYFEENGQIVFNRSLGIVRNAVVLPLGYEMVSSNYPAQVLQEADGRIAIAFWNNTPAAAPVLLRARKSAAVAGGAPAANANAKEPADRAGRLDERAHQNREIVYFLQQPETHAFDLYHDYTELREGVSYYVNEVRAGSTVSNPRARVLDTGEELKHEVIKGEAITKANVGVRNVTPASEIVVFRFAPVPKGGSTRLRMYETYTDTARYKVLNGELIWNRAFGRPTNAVVLPAGWALTNSSIPAAVTELPDGRTRLDFINSRPDEVNVLITARKK